MAEALTESFCERCGTRYELHAPTRLNPLRKTRGFIGGLRNYLTSQDALSDAMGDAMRSEEENLASAQLEAFHESFNFCIDCRQYTCLNCWNDGAGRCRSCAPIPGTDDLADRLAASVATPLPSDLEPAVAAEDLDRGVGLEAWPSSDLPTEAAVASNGEAAKSAPSLEAFPTAIEPEPVVAEVEVEPEPEPQSVVTDVQPEPEPVVAQVDVEPLPEPVVAEFEVQPEMDSEPVAAELEAEPSRPALRVVAWDEDNAYDLIEPQPEVVEAEPEPIVAEVELEPAVAEVEVEPEPQSVAAEAEPEPIVAEVALEPSVAEVEVEPEPQPAAAEAERVTAAEVEPEPQPVAAEAEPELAVAEAEPAAAAAEIEPEPEREPPAPTRAPISETILHFPTRPSPAASRTEDERAAAVADSPEAAARRAQLDMLGLGDPGQGPVTPEPPGALPYRSRAAGLSQAELARRAAPHGSFWEASAREVAGAGGHVGVQSCGQCGLSLSANARFCRRCGTRQAQSA